MESGLMMANLSIPIEEGVGRFQSSYGDVRSDLRDTHTHTRSTSSQSSSLNIVLKHEMDYQHLEC